MLFHVEVGFSQWQEFAGCYPSVYHPFQCHLWRPKTRLGDHQMVYFYVPSCFSTHLAVFHSALNFIIQSPLPGVDYIGYLRSSRPSPGLLPNDVQIFLFSVPPSFALWTHFCHMVLFLFPDHCLEAASLISLAPGLSSLPAESSGLVPFQLADQKLFQDNDPLYSAAITPRPTPNPTLCSALQNRGTLLGPQS